MTSTHRRGSALIALLVALGLAAAATAQVPEGIIYQGYLTDEAGGPLDQPVNVMFSLYTVESGGSPIWSETMPLVPTQGLFATTLGVGISPFPVGLFNTPLWMGITVGTDAEMTPRRALSTVPYAKRAVDADTLTGLSASALDQSDDVLVLSNTLSNTNNNVNALSADVSGNTAAILGVESQADGNSQDISQLQSDLTITNSDLAAVENVLPTLQNRVSGTCASGSSIRQVLSTGGVTCETDDAGPWLFDGDAYLLSGTRVGLGTSAPAAAIQIDAAADVDPFRARLQASTKLRVHASNGSVSVGTSSAGPADGLFVSGNALIGIGTSTARLTVTDLLWQVSLDNIDVGGDDWFLGSSATDWNIGAGKFVISPTASSGNGAMVIDSNKDVGIGTTDPLTRLHLGGGTDVTPAGGGYLTVGGVTGTNIAVDDNEIMARSNGVVAPLSLNAEGGEVRINTNGDRDDDALEIRGRVYFDNGGNSGMRITGTNSNPTNALLEPTLFEEGLIGVTERPFWRVYSREFYALSPIEYRTYSDRSLKQNVRPIENALETVSALEGVAYELGTNPMGQRKRPLTDKEESDRRNQLGFIAQDLEKILPNLVREDESSGLKSVGYMGLIPVLVEAIKEQQRQIDAQQEQIEELRARL